MRYFITTEQIFVVVANYVFITVVSEKYCEINFKLYIVNKNII